MRLLAALCCLALVIGLAGCGSGVTPSGVNILIAVAGFPASNAIQVGTAAVTLNATVQFDGSNKGVTWTLSQAGVACAPACGTLVPSPRPSFSAVYTPPTNAPLNQQATIAAISVADDRQEFAFTFTIIPPPSVQITNKFTSIFNGAAPVEVDAKVANDPAAAGVSWTLTAGGSSCSPACGTLTASATPSLSAIYTPPTTLPTGANANPTITAASVTLTSATDSFAFTINSSASLVKGSYVFVLRGYYNGDSGAPMAIAGTLTADGNGNITGGELDIDNDGGVTAISAPQTGNYSVQLSATGIAQVAFEISSFTFPGSSNDLKFRSTLSVDGTRGRIIELDGSAFLNSGTIELQDSTAVSTKPTGNFAFGVNSDAPFGGRTVAAGQLVLGSAGVTGGLIDMSVDGGVAPLFVATPISPDIQSAPDPAGRGTLTITVQGKSVDYAYYIVDANHFTLIEIDDGLVFGTVFAGVARSQSALTASSVNGVSVIQLTGFDEPTGTTTVTPVSLVGLLTVTGGSSYTLLFDINDIGNSLTQHPAGGSVTFDPSTGRAVLSAPDGFQSNFVNTGAWYLYDTGKGFFAEVDPSTINPVPPQQQITNRALSGTTLPQTGGPFTATSLSGNVIVGFGASSSPDIPNLDLGLNFDSTAGTYSAAGDLTSVVTQGGNLIGIQFTGKYKITNLTEGYGRMLLPTAVFGDFTSPSGTQGTASFYMIAPNQFVGVGIVNGQPSGVFFGDPQ